MNFQQNSLLLLMLILCVNFNGVLLRKISLKTITPSQSQALERWIDVGFKSEAVADNNQDLNAAISLISSLGQAIPYAGPLAALISGILGLGLPSEHSIVMAKLDDISGKLDKLDQRIGEVLRTIKSVQTVVLFKEKHEHVKNLKLFYQRSINTTDNAETKADFKDVCKSVKPLTICRWIGDEVSGVTDLSLKSLMTQEYDMKTFNEWSNRIAALLSEATFLHITCVGVSNATQRDIDQTLNVDKKTINDVIKSVKNEFHKGNKWIKRNFFSHAKGEVESSLRDGVDLSNKDIADSVYNHLNSKYYWRKWGVFAWNDDTRTEYEHWYSYYGSNSWYWHHEHKRCFLAGSVLRYPDLDVTNEIANCQFLYNHVYYSGNYWDVTATDILNYLNGCIWNGGYLEALAVVRFTHGLRSAGGDGFFKNAEFPYYSSRLNPSNYSVIAIPKDSSPYRDDEVCNSDLHYCDADYHCCKNFQKCCHD